jgi:flagellar hook protein FlgE
MGISSSLYAGISGLSTLGNAMSVLGDNIANINTIAFKSSKSTFEDVLSQSVSTAAGSSQIGRGVTLSTVEGIFAQGSLESSDSPTHMAINGEGFFMLRDPASSAADMYTRAGQFRFDDNSYLVNPTGAFVQGWTLDPITGLPVGSVGDITLTKTTPPQATTNIQAIVNLDVRPPVVGTELVSAGGGWDGTAVAPIPNIASTDYQFSTSMKIYDSLGNSHDITTYYDTDPAATANQWEFLVTCDPSVDLRGAYAGQPGLGALMYGTITFDATGQISQIDAFDVAIDGSHVTSATVALGGYYSFDAEFIAGTPQTVEYNFGATNSGGLDFTPEALASTQYANASTTYYQDQNGFSAGFLQSVSVDPDGIITGHYSNGQVLPQARLALATFNNLVGLNKAGGNIFTETSASGVALVGTAGSVGLGSLSPNALEQSNVDLGTEFVKLITTQRGFQANSKILTTVDEMMAELVNLKR